MNKFIVAEKMEQKFVVCEKMEANDPEMTVVGWGSRPTIDRDKELIESSAWNLDNFRKNPVLLLCHQYNLPAIGKCLWIKAIPGQGLRFKAQFAKTDRGREVYELYSSGVMSAFSVGFKPRPNGVIDNPTDVKYKGCKKVFTDVELMEISCVPVPAHSDALIEHVKAGKIHTKQLKDELEAIIEIIEKSDELTIEIKSTDPNTNTEIKIEVTEDFVHVPAPGEEGKHKDCKIRTIPISKKDGIQAHYCVDEKTITSYIFDKQNAKKWDEKTAVKWVEDHKKELVFEVPESETEPINIKSEDAAWDTDGDIAFIDTKAVTPEADEAEKDFMTRCMGDKSMAKMNEGFRTNACKMMWKKGTAKEAIVEEKKEAEPVEEKAAFAKKDDESEDEFVARFLGDEKTTADYPDEKDRMAAAKEEWAKCNDKKKEPEPDAVITKQESVDEFLTRILPERTLNIKTAEELAQVFEKSSGYDDMKETVGAMEAQVGAMEPVPVSEGTTAKSADAEGNPSLYDLTGAVDRALNPMRNQNNSIPSPINDSINPPYRSVIDIFAVNYPSGHVVYSEYDRTARQSKYFQIGYEYDLKMRVATITGEPEEVLQSWISERYMIQGKEEGDVEHKDEQEIEVKAGKVLSAKNKKILTDCMDQMMSAHAAMEEMMKMAEGNMGEEKDPEDIEQKDAVESEEEFEIIEKEEDHIEFDLDAPVEKTDDGMLEIDEDMIKAAISSALKKNEIKVNTKDVAKEVFARLTGKAVLQ